MSWLRLLLDVAIVIAWVRTVIGLWRLPASRWRSGWLAKGFCLFLAVAVFMVWSGVVIPGGAVLVWWRVLLRRRDPFELPMADGRPMR